MVPKTWDSPFRVGEGQAKCREDEDVGPDERLNQCRHLPALPICVCGESDGAASNESKKSELLDNNPDVLSLWTVGYSDRGIGRLLGQCQSSGADGQTLIFLVALGI